ncbi:MULTISPECIES: glycosyltransferase family 4 protein [Burkholderia]|uniref:glycosyltransferase family 4 protein n=1 Tax=Burkholderia TaxID=32008 RepID=UPI000B7AC115|nr:MULTISPECIES: glycosyltransferase family 1 protein [Burkholderia]MBY4722339.1 glycosyltransferase family 4 protein [Burkholderia contaminans]MCI3971422.1 glycosyltransferase family 4 protein [Burkholderia sp. HI4860]MDN7786574.1 glycosyltransferase family 1 protein [Burkholderia contaminans]OXJ03877.1 transcription elongation factor GreAB [Burkholderia sp. AU33647]
MKLILSVDPIAHPLTGIGRYTWELARHYHTTSCEQPVRFLHGTRWVNDPALLLRPGGLAGTPGKSGWGKLLHSRRLARWRLAREIGSHFCHGPNYFLPEAAESGVVTVHDLSVFKFPETHPIERIRHFETGFASTLARARHLITDSEATRHEVAAYFGWPLERITAIQLGVSDAYRIHAEDELTTALAVFGLRAGTYTLCVSTLEPRKRVDRLIRAYGRLPVSLRQRFPLVLAGGKGWLNDALLAQIEQAEQAGWLRYLGFVPEASLPALYAGAHAFFFPSVYEGFGLPVLEALASGTPVLTSNSTSLPEVAGGAAWLVEPDHDDELLDGIERVLIDDEWRADAIGRGLEVASRHRWSTCGDRTLALCRKLAQ